MERKKRKRSEDKEQEGGRGEREARNDAGHVEQMRLSVGWVDLPVDDAIVHLHAGLIPSPPFHVNIPCSNRHVPLLTPIGLT